MSLQLQILASVLGQYTGANDIAAPRQDIAKRASLNLSTGVGANQADLVFTDTRTLAASATENLDLAGVLTDAFGQSLAFAEIVAILVVASGANANDVVIGGAASNGFVSPFGDATDTVKVKPGGTFLLTAPGAAAFAVTAGTGDLLKVTNGGAGTPVTYDIVLIGRTA